MKDSFPKMSPYILGFFLANEPLISAARIVQVIVFLPAK